MAHSSPKVSAHKESLKNDEWDDTALIEAYDRAMDAIKDQAGLKKKFISSRKTKKGSKTKWKMGDTCQALYSSDNMLYDAVILEVNEKEEKCVVQFLGYENEEEVDFDSLIPSETKTSPAKKDADKQWEIGDECIALFSDDGMYYPAVILEVYEDQHTCLVKFTGYNNEEEVYFENIHHSLKDTSRVSCTSHTDPEVSSLDESSSSFNSDRVSSLGTKHERKRRSSPRSHSAPNVNHASHDHPSNCYLPPTATLPIPALDIHEELGPMLMAWYMAGYHTGYYQGRTSRLASVNLMVPQPPPNTFHTTH